MFTLCTILILLSIKKIPVKLSIILSTKAHHRGPSKIELNFFPAKMINKEGIVNLLAFLNLKIGNLAIFPNCKTGSCLLSQGSFQKSVKFTKEIEHQLEDLEEVSIHFIQLSPSEVKDSQARVEAHSHSQTR